MLIKTGGFTFKSFLWIIWVICFTFLGAGFAGIKFLVLDLLAFAIYVSTGGVLSATIAKLVHHITNLIGVVAASNI